MISRVLIISTNQEMSPQPVAPVGAAWIAEALSGAGFEVRLLDLTFERDPMKKIACVLKKFEPQGIGISVRNVDNGDFLSPKSFLPKLKEITDFISQNSSARILIGGSGVSVMPRQILEYLDLDFAVMGEGEEAAIAFFKTEKPDVNCKAPGLICRKSSGSGPSFERGDWLVHPDLVRPRMHAWIDVRHYLRYEPVLPVQGKRGCANRCIYCTYNRIEGRAWRPRDPAVVAEEISNTIFKTGARTFEFVDSIFNQPEGYMEALLEEIIRWKLKAKFHVSSMSPKGLTKKQLALMERAGITAVGITPESACDVTLNALRKGFGEDEVHRAAELLGKSSIKALWCFLLGGPAEDAATLMRTINFINKGIAKKDNAFITVGVRIYPETPMRELAVSEGVISREDNLLMPTFYFSDKLTPEATRAILGSRIEDKGRVIFLSDTNFSSLGALRLIGTTLRLPSPFWSYAGYMNMLISRSRVINRGWDR